MSARTQRIVALRADVRRRLRGTSGRGRRLRGLLALLRPYRWRVVAMLVALIVGTGASLAPPPLAKLAIDQGIVPGNIGRLDLIVLAFVASALLVWVGTYWTTYLVGWVGQRALADLRLKIFTHLQTLPVGFYERRPAGVLISRITNDVEALDSLVTDSVVTLFQSSLTLFGTVAILLLLDVRLALLTFLIFPVLAIGSLAFRIASADAYRRTRETIGRITAYLQESLSGIRVVRSFGQEPRHRARFAALNDLNRDANMTTVKLNAAYFPAVELVSALATVGILAYGGLQVLNHPHGAVTIGVLVGFVAALNNFFDPIQQLSNLYTTYQSGMAALDKIFELLEEQPDLVERPDPVVLPRLRGELRFEDVTFVYGGDGTTHGGRRRRAAAAIGSADGGSGATAGDGRVRDGVGAAVAAAGDGHVPDGVAAAALAAAGDGRVPDGVAAVREARDGRVPDGVAAGALAAGDGAAASDGATRDGAGAETASDGATRDGAGAATASEGPVLALDRVDLDIPAGQTVALVGATGAGKSTFAKLVARFYDPTAGRVLVDGHDLRDVNLHSLRSQMGVVPQEGFLFSGTVRENIAFGRPDATDEQIETAAHAVGAHEFIVALEQGYDTEVGERGAQLSAGQRQLIAFARALIADPRILVLDEATSNVDLHTEGRIEAGLRRLLAGRTAIVIAHRLSTIRQAGRIVVLEHGRIVEQGTHDELIEAQGAYWDLYRDWAAQAAA